MYTNALPFGASAFSIPLTQFGGEQRTPDLRSIVSLLLGVELQELDSPHSDEEVVFAVARVIEGSISDSTGLPDYVGRPMNPYVYELAQALVFDPFVPVESSPLSGTSVTELVKGTTLMGFATLLEGYGLTHHDAVLVIATPVVVVVIGASVGLGEALRVRMMRTINPGFKPRTRKET
jgi:hypothetical protein